MTDDTRLVTARLVRFAPDVVVRRVGDEALALKLTAEAVYALNETAARVALLIDAGVSLGAIAEQLAVEYDQPLDVDTRQVDELVADFSAKGLIVGAGDEP
jgi:hypothetical protein